MEWHLSSAHPLLMNEEAVSQRRSAETTDVMLHIHSPDREPTGPAPNVAHVNPPVPSAGTHHSLQVFTPHLDQTRVGGGADLSSSFGGSINN